MFSNSPDIFKSIKVTADEWRQLQEETLPGATVTGKTDAVVWVHDADYNSYRVVTQYDGYLAYFQGNKTPAPLAVSKANWGMLMQQYRGRANGKCQWFKYKSGPHIWKFSLPYGGTHVRSERIT